MEAPSADNTKEGEPNWSTTRDFGQAWNPDTLREFNDYEWNRLNGTGVGAGSAKKGEAPGITAANLKDGVLGEGKYTPAEKYAMRDVKLNIGNDALIPEGSLRETRVPETRATEVRKMLAKTATGGVVQRPPPPPFDPRFEMSGDEMKRMYLSEHPEYHDVEMVRTGVNQ